MCRLGYAIVSAILVFVLVSQAQAQETSKSWSAAPKYQKFIASAEKLFKAQERKLELTDEEQRSLASEVAAIDGELLSTLGELAGAQAVDVRLSIALARARIQYKSALPIIDEMAEDLAELGKEPFAGRASKVRTTVARIYLEESLPWKAAGLLPQPLPKTAPVEARLVESQIQILLKTFDDDGPRSPCVTNDARSGLCRKLSHLLAVPPWQAGSYMEIRQTAREPMTEGGWRPAQANATSLLSFIAPSAASSKRASKAVAKPMASRKAPGGLAQAMTALLAAPASSSSQERLLDLLRTDPAFTKLLPKPRASASALRRDEAGEDDDAASSQVADVRRLGDATVVVIRTFREFQAGYLILRMRDRDKSRLNYWYRSDFGSMRHAFLPLGKPAQPVLVVSQAVGTGHFLSLSLFDPSAARVLEIYPRSDDNEGDGGVYHGAFQFIDFEFDNEPELQITYATGDRRYEHCNQCPTRRASEIWRLAPDLGEAHVIGRNVSWADLSVATMRTLTGLGPEISVSPQVTALDKALKELPSLRLPLAELRGFVENMNNAVAAYVGIGDWTSAAKACLSIADAVAAHSQANALQDLRGVALFNGMYATLRAGRFDDTARLLSEIDRSKIVFQDETRDRIDLVRFDIARQRGDLKTQYQLLERFSTLTRLQDEAAFREIAYLLEVGDSGGAVAAAQRAATLEDFANSNVRQEIAWQHAVALANLGRNGDALDQLLILAREAADSSLGEMLSKVYLLGAKIAFGEQQFEIGRHLLDASVSHMPEDFWKSEASLILSLYAGYHQGRGQTDQARLFLDKAVSAGQPFGGVRLAVPYDLLAEIAESEKDAKAATAAAITSLRALLGEQGQLVSETHKLSFVASADQIATRQLARLIRTEADASIQLAAIESWRSQVLRSIIRGERAADPSVFDSTSILAKIQDRLPDHTALVSYWVSSQSALAFVVEKTGLRKVPLPTTLVDLDAARSRLMSQLNPWASPAREHIESDRVPADMINELEGLYDALIKPLSLPPGISEIVLVPDERLFWIPWPALSTPTEAGARNGSPDSARELQSVLKQFKLRILPAALLVSEPRPVLMNSGLIAGSTLGVPVSTLKQVMPSLRNRDLPDGMVPLPGVRVEVRTISKLLSGAGIAIGDAIMIEEEQDAEKLQAALHDRIGKANIVHLAGHGLFDTTDPMASAMLLGGANSRGVIRAADLAGFDMTSAEIVALSGCETGLAELRPGQETLGFVRGVLAAGARRMLLTQWQVSDIATEKWFSAFYRRLVERRSPDVAYREATLEMAAQYRHPYYWAAIILYGR